MDLGPKTEEFRRKLWDRFPNDSFDWVLLTQTQVKYSGGEQKDDGHQADAYGDAPPVDHGDLSVWSCFPRSLI